jgi:hypothetical protein
VPSATLNEPSERLELAVSVKKTYKVQSSLNKLRSYRAVARGDCCVCREGHGFLVASLGRLGHNFVCPAKGRIIYY